MRLFYLQVLTLNNFFPVFKWNFRHKIVLFNKFGFLEMHYFISTFDKDQNTKVEQQSVLE